MKNLLLNILLLVLGCGSDYSIYTHHYDLSKPIYINLEDKLTADGKSSFPCAAQFKQGLENAIIQAGGSVSEASPTAQIITLLILMLETALVIVFSPIQSIPRWEELQSVIVLLSLMAVIGICPPFSTILCFMS